MITLGNQTITATDTVSGINGSGIVMVNGADVISLSGAAYGSAVTASQVDNLRAGSGAGGYNLLIGGTTAYDREPRLGSWQAMAAYWAGADDYFTRATNVTSGNGVPLLDPSTAAGNGGGNILNGNDALTLLYTDGQDNIVNFDPGSQTVIIAP